MDGCGAGCSESIVGLLVILAGSGHSWLQGLLYPKVGAGLLVGETESWGGSLRCPMCPRAGDCLLVGESGPRVSGCKALRLLELVLAHWWVKPVPNMTACGICGVLKLVLAQWRMGSDPNVTAEGSLVSKDWSWPVAL